MTQNTWDLIVIGGGSAGCAAAERAAVHGWRVLLIEKADPGGASLNQTDVPIRVLLQSSQRFTLARQSADYGIEAADVRFSLTQAMQRKQNVVAGMRAGIVQRLQRHKVQIMTGEARFLSRNTIEVDGQTHQGARILIATGSRPLAASVQGAHHPHVLTPAQMLAVEQLPAQMVVINATATAISIASIFASLGTHVTVLDAQPALLADWEPEIIAALRDSLASIQFSLNSEVIEITPSHVHIRRDGQQMMIACDAVLLDSGRTPEVSIAGIEYLDLDHDASGIRVDPCMLTNLPDLYAAGSVTGRTDSAHGAIRMAHVAVHAMLGKPDRFRQSASPALIYGLTEAAKIGLTEAEAIRRGIPILTASTTGTSSTAPTHAPRSVTPVARNMAKHHGVDLAQIPARGSRLDAADVRAFLERGSASSYYLSDPDGGSGAYKVIVHRHTRQILGVHMVGASVSEQVFGIAAMLEDEFRVDDVQQIIFPRPTFSAVLHDLMNELSVSN